MAVRSELDGAAAYKNNTRDKTEDPAGLADRRNSQLSNLKSTPKNRNGYE